MLCLTEEMTLIQLENAVFNDDLVLFSNYLQYANRHKSSFHLKLLLGENSHFLQKHASKLQQCYLIFFLVGYVEERLWWPIQSPNIGRKKKASSKEDREVRSSLLILDLKDGKL